MTFPTTDPRARVLFLLILLVAGPLWAQVLALDPETGESSDRRQIRLNERSIENRLQKGHVQWDVNLDQAGEYELVFEHKLGSKGRIELEVILDGRTLARAELEGADSDEYIHQAIDLGQALPAGEHRLVLAFKEAEGDGYLYFRDLRLTKGYAGDYGFIQTGLGLDSPQARRAWARAMSQARQKGVKDAELFARRMWNAFPVMSDWFLQDNVAHGTWGQSAGFDSRGDYKQFLAQPEGSNKIEAALAAKVAGDLGIRFERPEGSRELLEAYVELCMKRRLRHLAPLARRAEKIIYATHQNMGSVYLETESESCPDGSQLRMIHLPGPDTATRDEVLFDSSNGIVRDPDLSDDAKKLLFSWRKHNGFYGTRAHSAPETGNYKIYEMELASREIRPLTDDSTYGSDIDPVYLPGGDIMFGSQRCITRVSCGWSEAANMYLMNQDGKYARRVGFDQTQTAFPTVLPDGRVVYTRRDYNDRGQTYAHSLFVMNADGTKQTEYYGNQTFEPTSLQHTRPIPGTGKTMSIAGGYHVSQGGKLVIIEPSRGTQDYRGLTFINWDPSRKRTGGDNYGREGDQYAYPYPLDEESFLVSYAPIGGYLMSSSGRVDRRREDGLMRYKIYFMTRDGRRELLAADPVLSCCGPVPVMARPVPTRLASTVDYTRKTGVMYVQNVYFGAGTRGVEPGTIKRIRVNELYYKPALIGGATWGPPRDQVGSGKKYASIGKHSVTPVGVGTASFDAKGILGEVEVHRDGSAMFEVPARRPIYLQLIDEKGQVVQSMRSWATLMPGERFSCVGCHEDKATAALDTPGLTVAMKSNPQELQPFHDVSGKPFSYAKMIQPIWDKHCVSCHAPGKKAEKIDLTRTIVADGTQVRGVSTTKRRFFRSYLTLLKADTWRPKRGGGEVLGTGMPNEWVNYYTRLLTVEQVPPYYAGSARSGLIRMLRKGHKKVNLSQAELEKVSAWIDLNVPFIGRYDEMNNWSQAEKEMYQLKLQQRQREARIEEKNIRRYILDGQP